MAKYRHEKSICKLNIAATHLENTLDDYDTKGLTAPPWVVESVTLLNDVLVDIECCARFSFPLFPAGVIIGAGLMFVIMSWIGR